MSKCLVLSVKTYDFENDLKERISGATISYLGKRASTRENEVGFPPLIVNVRDGDLVNKFGEVPGIYDLDFEQVAGRHNKPEITLVDVESVGKVDMSLLFEGSC